SPTPSPSASLSRGSCCTSTTSGCTDCATRRRRKFGAPRCRKWSSWQASIRSSPDTWPRLARYAGRPLSPRFVQRARASAACRFGEWSFGSFSVSSRVRRLFPCLGRMPLPHLFLLLLAATSGAAAEASPADSAWEAWADFPGQPLYTTTVPLEYERSALFAPPLLMPKGCFAVSARLDYASAILLYNSHNSVLLDAEIGHLDFAFTLKLSPSLFLLAMGGVQGAYAGFMDQFLNWYHGLFGIPYPARAMRPINKFGYYFQVGTERQTF